MIQNGELADADDIEKNIVTFLEGINQATINAKDNSTTDKSYTYASSDIFSDSNGYNNTLNTGSSTGTFDTNLYFATGATASNETDNSETNTNLGGYNLVKTMTLTQLKRVTKVDNQIKNTSSQTAQCKIIFYYSNGTTAEVINNTTSSTYVAKTYTNPNTNKLVSKVEIYLGVSGSASTSYENNDVVTAFIFNTNAIVLTNSKTFSSNVKSILVTANKVLNGNSTITYDVSSDGGSVYEKTAQALNSVIELDGDDTDVVIKFNLNVDSGNTPELYGYSYQVWI